MPIFSSKQEQVNKRRLCDLFGFPAIDRVEALHHGYKSNNFLFEADHKTFFLKVYNRLGHVAHEIKCSEQYFADAGIPVLLPLADRYGRQAFMLDQTWCSLFPFVNGVRLRVAELTANHVRALAELMAKMHKVGEQADHHLFTSIHFWQHEHFFWEQQELVDLLNTRSSQSELDQLVLQILEEKAKLVKSHSMEISQIPNSHRILIHGDLIYQNVFWHDDGTIAHLFDFEKTCIAPRAYEFARSLMINCFDEGWGDVQFERAQLFLNTYRLSSPFSFEEFLSGVHMYWMNVAHMLWLETKYVFSESAEASEIYRSHAHRVLHIGEDPKVFCERIYGDH